MLLKSCRRCGANALTENPELHPIECAGEVAYLCGRCHDEFKNWFYRIPETAPEIDAVVESA
jgi:hypothetical protein